MQLIVSRTQSSQIYNQIFHQKSFAELFRSFIQMTQESKSYAVLLKSALFGVWRGVFGLPLEHPFDTIKTNMQSYQTNFYNTTINIYRSKGVLGFYSGFIVNSLRVASKQLYRWPLSIAFFGFYGDILKNYEISRAQLGMICGLNMAIFQVAIICPFQRIKVWLMTAKKKQTYKHYFRSFTIKALFDGMVPVFYRQLLSWVSFLGAQQYFKDLAYQITKKKRLQQDLSVFQYGIVSSLVALVNTFFVMPLDCIKSNFQKYERQGHIEQNSYKGKFRKISQQIYQKYGMMGFYKGWHVKLVQYTINSCFTVIIYESLLKEYEMSILNKSKNQ